MPKNIARYAITTGLAGCYMPDSVYGPFSCATRRELASIIMAEIEAQDFPKTAFAQAHIRRTWGFIARHGSSTAHFSIQHNGREIAFRGLTEAEAAQMESEND